MPPDVIFANTLAFNLARAAGPVFLGALFLVVLLKMTSGTLNIGAITLGRGQLLIVTFGCAAAYWFTTVQSGHLPQPDPVMLSLLGASNGVYLGFKLAENWSALFGKT
jgi:hypothetical protein